jgi:hypothetical protein
MREDTNRGSEASRCPVSVEGPVAADDGVPLGRVVRIVNVKGRFVQSIANWLKTVANGSRPVDQELNIAELGRRTRHHE